MSRPRGRELHLSSRGEEVRAASMRESNQILSEENKVLKKSNHDKDKEIAKKNV